jgi:hypothetical protein
VKEPLSFATFLSGSGERKVDEEKKMKLKKKKALFFASSSAIPKSEGLFGLRLIAPLELFMFCFGKKKC